MREYALLRIIDKFFNSTFINCYAVMEEKQVIIKDTFYENVENLCSNT